MSSWGSVNETLLISGDARFVHGPGSSGTPQYRFVRAEEVDCTARETVSVDCLGANGTPAE